MIVPPSARRLLRAAGRQVLANMAGCLAASGIVAVGASLSGCYSYLPATVEGARPKATVAAEISDVGRVALTQQAGSEVSRIEGQLVDRSDSTLRITVSEVRYLNGITNKWQGQDVVLRRDDVKAISQRTFSRSRTAIAVAVFGALVLAAIFNKALGGLFSGDPNRDKPGEPPPSS